jgi:anti-sigma factor RsiW
VSAEELIRFVDGEGAPMERTRIRRHLRRCRPCLELARDLRGTTRALELRFTELDDAAAAAYLPSSFQAVQRLRAAPSRARARMLPRAAAVLALAAIGAAAASPLRSRVLDWLAGEGGAASVSVQRPPPSSSRPAPVAVPEEYRFIPEGDTFIVHFNGAQDESSLTLRVSDGHEAVIQVAAAASAHPPVFVMPNGVRIGAAGAGGVRYGIAVPPSVRTIVLRTDDGEPPTTLSARTVRERGEARIRLGPKR